MERKVRYTLALWPIFRQQIVNILLTERLVDLIHRYPFSGIIFQNADSNLDLVTIFLSPFCLVFFVGFHPFGQTFKDHYIFNLIWVIFGLTICGLPNKILNVSGQIVTAEALDYMEWKHGLRNEALVTTVQGYFGKLATSVTGWLSGMVLTWINYVPLTDSLGNAVPQTDPTMLNGIWAVFCILPALARGLYGVSFIIYPIHGDLQQQMIVELAEKRAQRLAEQEAKDHQA